MTASDPIGRANSSADLDRRGEDDRRRVSRGSAYVRPWLRVHLASARVHRRADAHARREDTAGPG